MFHSKNYVHYNDPNVTPLTTKQRAQVIGSKTHASAAAEMNALYGPNGNKKADIPFIQNVEIEQNYLNGNYIPNNAKGSSRLDMIITNNVNSNVLIADIKTGNAKYKVPQMNKNMRNYGGLGNPQNYTYTHVEMKP